MPLLSSFILTLTLYDFTFDLADKSTSAAAAVQQILQLLASRLKWMKKKLNYNIIEFILLNLRKENTLRLQKNL